jgi:hypothetical protein
MQASRDAGNSLIAVGTSPTASRVRTTLTLRGLHVGTVAAGSALPCSAGSSPLTSGLLHRPAPAAGRRGNGTRPDLPFLGGRDGSGLRRGHDQCPASSRTENLFDAMILRRMMRGAYLVNTARSATENEHTQAIFLQMAQVWQGERAAGGRQGTRLRPRHAIGCQARRAVALAMGQDRPADPRCIVGGRRRDQARGTSSALTNICRTTSPTSSSPPTGSLSPRGSC